MTQPGWSQSYIIPSWIDSLWFFKCPGRLVVKSHFSHFNSRIFRWVVFSCLFFLKKLKVHFDKISSIPIYILPQFFKGYEKRYWLKMIQFGFNFCQKIEYSSIFTNSSEMVSQIFCNNEFTNFSRNWDFFYLFLCTVNVNNNIQFLRNFL